MNISEPNSSPSLKEQLVAYLDGELDDASSRDLEHLLSTDPRARQELHQMEMAWDLLDTLPRAEVDQAFTESTIEMLAVSLEKDLAQEAAARPQRDLRNWSLGAAALVAACVFGFASVASLSVDPNEQLLDDLPLLQRLDPYRQVEDIQFLRDLHAANVLKDVQPQSEEPTNLADRRMLVEGLSPTGKAELQDKQERFLKLPPEERNQLKKLHEAVQNDADAAQLRGTMAAYYEWLLKLPPSQRATLASADASSRVEKIQALRDEENLRDAERPEPADLDTIAAWLEERVRPLLPKEHLEAIDRLPSKDRQAALMLWVQTRPPGLWRMPAMTSDTLTSLIDRLSPKGKAKLALLAEEEERRRKLDNPWDGWISQAVRHSVRRYFDDLAAVSADELLEFSKQLPEKEREGLMRLSADYLDHRLKVMYVMQKKQDSLPEFARGLKPESLIFLRGSRGDGRGPGYRDRDGSPVPFGPPPRRPDRPSG